MERFLTAKEVADILQISSHRVYDLARQRMLPCLRLGRQVRFLESTLMTLAEGDFQAANSTTITAIADSRPVGTPAGMTGRSSQSRDTIAGARGSVTSSNREDKGAPYVLHRRR
jgi:excisionase family DNA binding protein